MGDIVYDPLGFAHHRLDHLDDALRYYYHGALAIEPLHSGANEHLLTKPRP